MFLFWWVLCNLKFCFEVWDLTLLRLWIGTLICSWKYFMLFLFFSIQIGQIFERFKPLNWNNFFFDLSKILYPILLFPFCFLRNSDLYCSMNQGNSWMYNSNQIYGTNNGGFLIKNKEGRHLFRYAYHSVRPLIWTVCFGFRCYSPLQLSFSVMMIFNVMVLSFFL